MSLSSRAAAGDQTPASETRLLVFPANMDSALPFIRVARSLGFAIVGASSVPGGTWREHCDCHVHLPFVTDANFDAALEAVLIQHQITHVHAPHHGVWWHLKGLGARIGTRFHLCQPHPFASHWQEFAPSLNWAEGQAAEAFTRALPLSPRGLAPPLTTSQLAGLHRNFLRTPGETDEEKLSGLCVVARLAPAGDVVEIGSLYGRSAQALSWLAGHYRIGSTLCVDPWNPEATTDQGPAAQLLMEDVPHIDLEKVFRNFLATAAIMPGTSYIRAPADVAIDTYRRAIDAGSYLAQDLDPVPIQGRISLLHIDGNHRYDHVCADIRNWTPYLAEHGWLMLDDYIWAFGDGPRRAGDELLTTGDYDHAFVISDTLFLRRRAGAISHTRECQ